MKINKEIIRELDDFKIDVKSGLSYLLSVYFDCQTPLLDPIKDDVLCTGILECRETDVKWNVPLFEELVKKKDEWDWVDKEYIELFKPLNKDTNNKESLIRIKKLFKDNPHLKKEDIIGATQLYIHSTEPKYVRLPHYFIQKGVGVAMVQDILVWVKRYHNLMEADSERDVSRRLI